MAQNPFGQNTTPGNVASIVFNPFDRSNTFSFAKSF
jgi:hypothetical protein